jgi:hypothetical protein
MFLCNLKALAYHRPERRIERLPRLFPNANGLLDRKGTPRLTRRYLVPVRREGLIMTNRRRSAAARLVPAQTPERLFELTQEHIRPLIAMIDQLNEAGAEDELRVISKQLTRLVYRAQLLPPASSPKSRSAHQRAAFSPS